MRVHGRVSVSAVSSWSWSLDDDLAFYARAGIGAVGLSYRKLLAAGSGAVDRVRASGLRVTNLIQVGGFTLDDPSRWDAERAAIATAAATAARVGAECMVMTSGAPRSLPWEEAADALEAALAPLDTDGVPIAIEHTNSFRVDLSFVHTLRDAVDLARRLGAGVCMEVNACWMERDLATTVRGAVADGVLRLVQVSDFVVGTLATPDRAVPGDGDIPLARILGDVLAAGYTGALDLELAGPRIEAEGYEPAITRSLTVLDALLVRLGA